ncbi:MAG: response regulator [Candidatus Woesearchaeota archaeon]
MNKDNDIYSIIVVDDEPSVRNLMSACCRTGAQERNPVVIAYENGAAAWEYIRALKKAPNLLVTDYVMPRMNGKKLIINSRKKFPNLDVILVSGGTDGEGTPQEIADKLNVEFMPKPLSSVGALVDLVRKYAAKEE